MKFGIYLPNFGSYGEARVLANLAQDTENSGWDGFFIWDHIAGWTLPMVDSWVALAAIAVPNPYRHYGYTPSPASSLEVGARGGFDRSSFRRAANTGCRYRGRRIRVGASG